MENYDEEFSGSDTEFRETPIAVSRADLVIKIILGGLAVPATILMFIWHWLVLIDTFTVISPLWFFGVALILFIFYAVLTAASYADSEFYIFRRREKKESFIFRHSNDRHFTPCLAVLGTIVTGIDALSWLVWSFSGAVASTNGDLEKSTTYKEHVYLALNVFSTLIYFCVLIAFILRTSLNASLRSVYLRDEAVASAASIGPVKNTLKRIF